MSPTIPAFVINLDRDQGRWASIADRLAGFPCLSVARVAAVDGRELPAAACLALTQNPNWVAKRGEIGCFLSHAKAWEAVAGQAGTCLVLEDDAIPAELGRLASLPVPDDADMVFVNDRMAALDTPDGVALGCVPVTEGVRTLNRSGRGVGGDGYLLTPQGARKILSAVACDLFFGHVDWRLLRYGLRVEDLLGDLAGTRCDEILRHHHHPRLAPQWGVVRSYCLNRPLVSFPARGNTSSRIKANA